MNPSGATHVSLLSGTYYQRTTSEAFFCNYWSLYQSMWLPCSGVLNKHLDSKPFEHVLVPHIVADSEWMLASNIEVHVNRSLDAVLIKHPEDSDLDIVFSTSDAEEFIKKCDELFDEVATQIMENIELHLAKPYAENFC